MEARRWSEISAMAVFTSSSAVVSVEQYTALKDEMIFALEQAFNRGLGEAAKSAKADADVANLVREWPVKRIQEKVIKCPA